MSLFESFVTRKFRAHVTKVSKAASCSRPVPALMANLATESTLSAEAASPRFSTRTSPRQKLSSPSYPSFPLPPSPNLPSPSSLSASAAHEHTHHARSSIWPPVNRSPFSNSQTTHLPFHFGGRGQPGGFAGFPNHLEFSPNPSLSFQNPSMAQGSHQNPSMGLGPQSALFSMKPLKVCNTNAANQQEATPGGSRDIDHL